MVIYTEVKEAYYLTVAGSLSLSVSLIMFQKKILFLHQQH